jgi:hypothetical protein
MSNETGLSVRFATLDQNCFEDVNAHNRHIYRMVLSITGDIGRGGKALPSFFSTSSQGQRFSPESAVTK